MAEPTTVDARAAQAVLVCRLRHKILRGKASPLGGEVELQNTSDKVVEIEMDMHPLQYLNLVVTDSVGTIISSGHYGDIFSPLGTTRTLRLAPKEKFAHNVALLGTVPEERRKPGRYFVQAIYQYKGLKSVSEPLEVQLEKEVPPSHH
jgi:hypothetical protein